MLHANLRDEVWNIAIISSSPYQIRGSSHLRLLEKPFVICLHILQISGDKKTANSWCTRLSAYGIYTVCGFWWRLLDSNYRDYLLSIQIHSLKPLFATVSGCPLRHPSTFTTIKNQALKGKIREKGKTKPPSQMHLPAFPFPLKRPLLKMHFQKLSFLYPVWAPEWSPPRPPPDTVKWCRGLVLCSASRFGFSAERPASQCWHSISVSTDTV